jgi:hypothetical protein
MKLLVYDLLYANFPHIMFLPDAMIAQVVSQIYSCLFVVIAFLQMHDLLRTMQDGVDDFVVFILFMNIGSQKVFKNLSKSF